jgi:hypothetical protein
MKTLGNRATAYCEYCQAHGIWNNSIYCPCSPPKDPPREEIARNGTMFPWNGFELDRRNLPLRKNDTSRKLANHIVKDLCTECPKRYGIRGESILLHLPSIDFPRSFPPDMMHLFFENVIPSMFRHYRGIFFRHNSKTASAAHQHTTKRTQIAQELEDDSTSSLSADTETLHPAKQSKRKTKTAIGGADKLTKFILTDDPWNIPPTRWVDVGAALEKSAANFPLSFGDPLRNFASHCHQLKAAEWVIVAKHAAPIFLKTLLPAKDYEGFLMLVDAVLILEKHTYTAEDLQNATNLLVSFSEYYEDRFYRQQWDNLRVCLPTFHQLLHVTDAIHSVGPMLGYWQWPMERLCGMITQTAKSRTAANQNIANVMVKEEQKNYLPYVLPPEPDHETYTFEGADGDLRLAKFLTRNISEQAPTPLTPEVMGNEETQPVNLIPPARKHTLNRLQLRCLCRYRNRNNPAVRNDEPGSESDEAFIDDYTVDYCMRYAAAQFSEFTVTSWLMRRSNSTRCNSIVRYEFQAANGHTMSAFGRVLLFLEAETEEGTKETLAFLSRMSVEIDERLVYLVQEAGHEVVRATAIREIMGLIEWNRRQYFVGKKTSLILPSGVVN